MRRPAPGGIQLGDSFPQRVPINLCAGNDICYNQTALKPRRYEWPPQLSLK